MMHTAKFVNRVLPPKRSATKAMNYLIRNLLDQWQSNATAALLRQRQQSEMG